MSRDYLGPGLGDEEFYRESGVPMTKSEIRILSLARLRLFPGAVVYDVGAGTGSVAIEMKLLVPSCQVYAVECDPRALEVLKTNCHRFEVELNLVEGAAPAALQKLPPADRIFIGGSGGRLGEIITTCHQKLRPGGRLVVNSVSLNTGPGAYQIMEDLGYQVEAAQVNIAVTSRQGAALLWKARNPVTIICGTKGGSPDVLG